MEYRFGVPTGGPLVADQSLGELAKRGEELGFDIVFVSDHVVIPRNVASQHPYREPGESSGMGSGPGVCLEQLTTLAYLAGQTSKARLLTSVMVVPYRSAVLTAKMLASIDVLSKGRLILGCGVGWMREEFEAIGAASFEKRGAVADEYIGAFKELWTSENPRFEGKYCRFSDLWFLPKPVQRPHPPIWIGGESPAALRRAARLGDGWYPIGNNPRFPVGTLDELRESIGRLRRYAEEAGRDGSEIDVAYNSSFYDDRRALLTGDGRRRLFTGTPEQIAEDISSFEDMGVRHLMLNFPGETMERTLDHMERFAVEVRPLV